MEAAAAGLLALAATACTSASDQVSSASDQVSSTAAPASMTAPPAEARVTTNPVSAPGEVWGAESGADRLVVVRGA